MVCASACVMIVFMTVHSGCESLLSSDLGLHAALFETSTLNGATLDKRLPSSLSPSLCCSFSFSQMPFLLSELADYVFPSFSTVHCLLVTF